MTNYKLSQGLFENSILYCIISIPFLYLSYAGMLILKAELRDVFKRARMQELNVLLLDMSKEKWISKEYVLDLYKGGNDYFFKKSIGDTLEEFMASGSFLK